jgi:putative Flp pilus-assembly TadE/G-like protein
MLPSINTSRRFMLTAFARDERGITAVTTGLALAMLAGFAGLAIDASAWQAARRDMQGAADQAAYSAAAAVNAGANGTLNAKGITAQMGYVDTQNGVAVTVNNPPASGPNNTNNKAWEVMITKPQPMWFAGLFMATAPSATARAVATEGVPGQFCLLALDTVDSGTIDVQGTPQITTPSCNVQSNSSSSSAITLGGSATLTASTVATVGNPGIYNNGSGGVTANELMPSAPALKDPYASVTVPPSSTWGTCSAWPSVSAHTTISPGCYTGSLSVGNNKTLTMSPGTYYVDRGSISSSQGTITGTGVTIVLTSSTGSNWSSINIGASATVSLTAQTSGTFSGLVLYADPRIPTGTQMTFGGGSTQIYTGDLYFPTVTVNFNGNSSAETCSRLIAYKISLGGTSTFESSCSGLGTASLAGTAAVLEE